MANISIVITADRVHVDLGDYSGVLTSKLASWVKGDINFSLTHAQDAIIVTIARQQSVEVSQDGTGTTLIVDTVNGLTPTSTLDLFQKIQRLLDVKNPSDMAHEISRTGFYQGKEAKVFNIFGRRAGFTSTNDINDIKEFANGVDRFPAYSNASLDIVSSSVNDTSGGTGIRTVKVVYIDNNNDLVESAAIALNGTTPVLNVLTGVNEVLWMESETAGTGIIAAGNIVLSINGTATEVEQISAGNAKSMSCKFMVPAGFTGYVLAWDGNAINNDQDLRLSAQVDTLTKELTTLYHFQAVSYVPSNTSHNDEAPAIRIPALARVKVSTISGGTAGTVKANTSMQIAIIKD